MLGQSRSHSALEAVANVIIGYWIAVGAQMVIFPLFDMHPSFRDNISIGLAFTVVSLARSYLLRRAFNWLHVRIA